MAMAAERFLLAAQMSMHAWAVLQLSQTRRMVRPSMMLAMPRANDHG